MPFPIAEKPARHSKNNCLKSVRPGSLGFHLNVGAKINTFISQQYIGIIFFRKTEKIYIFLVISIINEKRLSEKAASFFYSQIDENW